jgi:hypothetical protein
MNTSSSIFMLIGASGLVIFLGLPLLLFPITWGHLLGWTIPEQTDLASYFGRSLGGMALSIAIMGYFAAYDPWQYRFVFDLVILIGLFLTGVHAYGYLKKNQPVIENVEITLYALMSFLTWYLYCSTCLKECTPSRSDGQLPDSPRRDPSM